MNVVRFREMIIFTIAGCALFACAEGTNIPSGGDGGEGGDTWGGKVSSSSASGSSSSGAGGAGSGTKCDAASADCTACISCSRTGADGLCGKQYQDCLANSDCSKFATCISNCEPGMPVCTSDCESFYPTGVPIFDAYASCVICQDCYGKCEGATSCK